MSGLAVRGRQPNLAATGEAAGICSISYSPMA
jgi:hypothetical protein